MNMLNAPTETPHHVVVVEDDDAMRNMLGDYLDRQGLRVTRMSRAEELMRDVPHAAPDLVVMDIGLPGMSGLDACRNLRLNGYDMPLILLTARCEEVDRVLGLEMGADDYLGKPFSARELLARIRAALRRAHGQVTPPKVDAGQEVRIGQHVFDIAARSLRLGNQMRMLNPVEYAMLSELVRSPQITVSREALVSASHQEPGAVMLRAVDAAIMRLRKVVEDDPARPRHIQTVRGQGYVFVP